LQAILTYSTPHAARGNNAQAWGILQTADVTEQRDNETRKKAAVIKTPGDKHIVINKWATPLVGWNRISQK
jgi:hypothetical protein